MEALRIIEEACADFQVPSTRAHAEQILVEFRKTPNVLENSQFILENSQTPFVQFQAASCIREVVRREWSILPKAKIESIRDYLLTYLATRCDILKPFVREQILTTVSVILKTGWLEATSTKLDKIYEFVGHMFKLGISQKVIGLSLLLSICHEFSSKKASASGFTWDHHFRCRLNFETTELLKILGMNLELLNEIIKHNQHILPENQSLILVSLSIIETTLSWEFASNERGSLSGSFRFGEMTEVAEITYFEPPKNWREMILNPDFLNLLFQLHAVFSTNSLMRHQTLQCLIQLSTSRGGMFENDSIKIEFSRLFIMGILGTIERSSRLQEIGAEVLGISQMIKQLSTAMGIHILVKCPNFMDFIKRSTELTVFCLKNAIEESDETWNMESFDNLLLTYSYFIIRLSSLMDNDRVNFINVMSSIASKIFNAYMLMRLSFKKSDMDEESESDQISYEDQLIAIGLLGRLRPLDSINTLNKLIQEKFALFQNIINGPKKSEAQITQIHENLHWMILVSGFILADSSKGEQPSIPEEIVNLSKSFALSNQEDPVVALINTIFFVLEGLCFSHNDPRINYCSPVVITTLYWFVERWSSSYLYPEERYITNISPSLKEKYFKSSPQAANILSFLVTTMGKIMLVWNGEPDVVKQIAKTLVGFSSNKEIKGHLINNQNWFAFVNQIIQLLPNLNEESRCDLLKPVVSMASGSKDATLQNQYICSITNVSDTTMQGLLSNPEFMKISQRADSISKIVMSTEILIGAAMASDGSNSTLIFNLCSRYFDTFIKLLKAYKDSMQVVNCILRFYNSFAEFQTPYMNTSQINLLYKSTLDVLLAYSSENIGKRFTSKIDEEEQCEDVSLILQMLSNLIARDFLDFNDDGGYSAEIMVKPEQGETAVSDVVFYGLSITLPLINLSLLEFPVVCTNYFKLASFMMEIYPEKLEKLPDELFNSLLKSIEFGAQHHLASVARLSFEAIGGLAAHFRKGSSQEKVSRGIVELMRIVFEILVFKNFDYMLLDSSADALFSLICSNESAFYMIGQECLAKISDLEVRNRFSQSLSALLSTNGVRPVLDRKNHSIFKQNLETFLMTSRAFLRVL